METHFDPSRKARISPLSVCDEFYDGVIRLEQYGKDHATGMDCFRVTYGRQIDDDLTYGEACAKLGQALLHYLSCEGKVDNRERGRG
jgi:hypothetical protein